MASPEAYAEELAALRGLIAQPHQGIHLLEFATIPQLDGILADLRPICTERDCAEVRYDPAKDSAGSVINQAREEIAGKSHDAIPLLILRPIALPDATNDEAAATAFWKVFNFGREALGALEAQILLCVDPWHYSHLVDEALDLLSWIMPKFHLIPPAELSVARTEMFTGNLVNTAFPTTPSAARARWETFWPIVEKQARKGSLPPASIRRHILPLLESALATGNLVHARKVRDAAASTNIPPKDLVKWHELNAILACGTGDISLAEDHANRLLVLLERKENDKRTEAAASSLTKLSNLLTPIGDSAFSESINRKVLSHAIATVGLSDIKTLRVRHNLANSLNEQGKLADAAREYRSVIESHDAVHGSDNADALASRMGLASTLHESGRPAEAEVELRKIIPLLVRLRGPEHPETLMGRIILANSIAAQGRYAEAEKEYREILSTPIKVSGTEHPKTLMCRMNLANVLHAQGHYDQSEEEYRALCSIRQRIFGPEHMGTLTARANWANALASLKRFDEAESESRAVIAIQERILGSHHPDTLTSYHDLAGYLGAQGKTAEGREFAQRAVDGLTKALLPEHQTLLRAKMTLEILTQPTASPGTD